LPATIQTAGNVIEHNHRIYTPASFARFVLLMDHQ